MICFSFQIKADGAVSFLKHLQLLQVYYRCPQQQPAATNLCWLNQKLTLHQLLLMLWQEGWRKETYQPYAFTLVFALTMLLHIWTKMFLFVMTYRLFLTTVCATNFCVVQSSPSSCFLIYPSPPPFVPVKYDGIGRKSQNCIMSYKLYMYACIKAEVVKITG